MMCGVFFFFFHPHTTHHTTHQRSTVHSQTSSSLFSCTSGCPSWRAIFLGIWFLEGGAYSYKPGLQTHNRAHDAQIRTKHLRMSLHLVRWCSLENAFVLRQLWMPEVHDKNNAWALSSVLHFVLERIVKDKHAPFFPCFVLPPDSYPRTA
jgi:hypothetical protein